MADNVLLTYGNGTLRVAC